VTSGQSVTVTWSGIASPTSTDWVGLYRTTDATSGVTSLAYEYVNCTQSSTVAAASGSCSFTIPSSVGGGSYELRLYAANGFTLRSEEQRIRKSAAAARISDSYTNDNDGSRQTA